MILAFVLALQQRPKTAVDSAAFLPLDLPAATSTRSASGAPGLAYWQQRVDYTIAVSLDTSRHVVAGRETIRYHNNSPDTLRFLWLQLDQNAYKRARRRFLVDTARAPTPANFDGGYTIAAIVQTGVGSPRNMRSTIDGTLMRVDLARPVAPRDSCTLELQYEFPIPVNGSNRMGRSRYASGWLYTIGQWFPRLAVYDDLNGWNTEQYLGQAEFYLEYGDIDYSITLPGSFTVVGSGELVNAHEVLNPEQRRRLALARTTDTAVTVVTPNAPATAPGGTRTWRFRATNVRDVAWAASPAFEWQGTGWNGVLLHTAFVPEAHANWRDALQIVRETISSYSQRWLAYPYATASAVAAPLGAGMEYPMLSFAPLTSGGRSLERVLLHEMGHQWMPMIVGSNERRHPWMDEGFDTFLNWVGIGRKPTGNGDVATSHTQTGRPGPIMQHGDSVRPADYDAIVYDAPDAGLELLRYDILDDSTRFDSAFAEYLRRWAFKHPSPADFFRTMNEGIGEDLSWFWRWWFYETSVLDLSIDSVSIIQRVDARPVLRINLSNPGGVPMVVPLTLTYADGATETVKLPAQLWRSGSRVAVDRPLRGDLRGVEIDALHNLPDGRRENNRWPRAP